MKKLNNKGYMLVEVIISSAIALVMAYFLVEITVKLVNKNNDYYEQSVFVSDKNILTKSIMDVFYDEYFELVKVDYTNGSNSVNFTFQYYDYYYKEMKQWVFTLTIDGNAISYNCSSGCDEEDEEEDYSYKKELSSDLIVGPLNINTYVVPGVNYTDTVNNALLFIKLPAYTNYSDEDYGLNLVIPYNTNKVNIEIKTPTE